jgi:hypothetical protein
MPDVCRVLKAAAFLAAIRLTTDASRRRREGFFFKRSSMREQPHPILNVFTFIVFATATFFALIVVTSAGLSF